MDDENGGTDTFMRPSCVGCDVQLFFFHPTVAWIFKSPRLPGPCFFKNRAAESLMSTLFLNYGSYGIKTKASFQKSNDSNLYSCNGELFGAHYYKKYSFSNSPARRVGAPIWRDPQSPFWWESHRRPHRESGRPWFLIPNLNIRAASENQI